jgi:hypothetical protein
VGSGPATDLGLLKRDGGRVHSRHGGVGQDHEEVKAQEGKVDHHGIKRDAMVRRILIRTKTLKTKKDAAPALS